jgi:hypothetical protein
MGPVAAQRPQVMAKDLWSCPFGGNKAAVLMAAPAAQSDDDGGSCLSFSKVSKQLVMSLCVAGVALAYILTSLQKCRKSFCVAGAVLLRRFQKTGGVFRGSRDALEIFIVILLGTVHSTIHTLHSTLRTPHDTPHSTFYTRLHTPLSTLHSPPSTLHTPHSTLYTPHCTLHTPHFTLHT